MKKLDEMLEDFSNGLPQHQPLTIESALEIFPLLCEGDDMQATLEVAKYIQAELMRRLTIAGNALDYVENIEKPLMRNGEPCSDWLSWYTTSSQQSERAADALPLCRFASKELK